MSLFAAFIKLSGKPVLVVGGGALAEPRIARLLECGARITVVAPHAGEAVLGWAQRGHVQWHSREFVAADAIEKRIVFAATGRPAVDRGVFAVCEQLGVLCNAIDDPEFCDFYVPAVVERGDLQIAISTNGQSPALAQHLRAQLGDQFDPSWRERVRELGEQRRKVMAEVPAGDERRRMLHQLATDAMDAMGGLS